MTGMKPNVCLMHGLTSIHGQNKRKLSPLIAPFGNHSFDITNASISYHLSSWGGGENEKFEIVLLGCLEAGSKVQKTL